MLQSCANRPGRVVQHIARSTILCTLQNQTLAYYCLSTGYLPIATKSALKTPMKQTKSLFLPLNNIHHLAGVSGTSQILFFSCCSANMEVPTPLPTMPPSPSIGLCFHRLFGGLRRVFRSGLVGVGPNGMWPVLLKVGSCLLLEGLIGDEGVRLGLTGEPFDDACAAGFIHEGE